MSNLFSVGYGYNSLLTGNFWLYCGGQHGMLTFFREFSDDIRRITHGEAAYCFGDCPVPNAKYNPPEELAERLKLAKAILEARPRL